MISSYLKEIKNKARVFAMEPTNAISMIMCLLITTIIFLSSFACAYDLIELGRNIAGNNSAEERFFFKGGLHQRGKAVSNYGMHSTVVDVTKIPALNTLGMCVARVDIEPFGVSPLHSHPQSSELVTVIDGIVLVLFLVPDPSDMLKSQVVAKYLRPGDVFVIPQGLIHFLYNGADSLTATLIQSFNSPYYAAATIPSSIFAADPQIEATMLAKSFGLDENVIADLQKKFRS